MKTNDGTPGAAPEMPKAEHGARSEVNWDGGEGRQPYTNQEAGPGSGPVAGHEAPEGDRGDASGRNIEQLEEIKRKP